MIKRLVIVDGPVVFKTGRLLNWVPKGKFHYKGEDIMEKMKPYWKYLVAILLGLAVRIFVPVDFGLTEVGRNMLAVLVGTIVVWVTDDIGWPSILAFSLYIVGGLPAGEMIAASWGSTMILMCIFCIMLTLTMSTTGVTPAIANWFITRKICQGRPYVFIAMFFTAFYVCCMIMDPTPVIMIFCSMADTICTEMGYKKKDKFYIALMVGILWISSFCQAATPISHTTPLLIMSTIEAAFGVSVTFGDWVKIGIPF